MERVYFIEYKGKKILYIDLSYLKANDINLFIEIIEDAKKIISREPLNSLLIITNLTNSQETPKSTLVLKEFAIYDKPYVKKSALVGIGGIKMVLLDAISKFSGRKFHTFGTVEEAKEFIVRDE